MALSFVHDVFEEIRTAWVLFAKPSLNLGVGRLNVFAQRLHFQLVISQHPNASAHSFGFRSETAIADEIR
jgi:hypothetical protein